MKKLLLTVLAVALTVGCAQAQEKAAPDFSLKTPDGKVITLSSYKGRPVILNFWTTWCHFCLQEIPDFVSFYNANKSLGLEIIGIEMSNDTAGAKRLIAQDSITYPVVIGNRDVGKAYGPIQGFPTTVLVDSQGMIVCTSPGMMNRSELEKLVIAYKLCPVKPAGPVEPVKKPAPKKKPAAGK
jgi:cytochrome c biogenesis protein CcmG, thiol:disulfide interchange protein DsbE